MTPLPAPAGFFTSMATTDGDTRPTAFVTAWEQASAGDRRNPGAEGAGGACRARAKERAGGEHPAGPIVQGLTALPLSGTPAARGRERVSKR